MSNIYFDTAINDFIEESSLSEKIFATAMFALGILIASGFISNRYKKINEQ